MLVVMCKQNDMKEHFDRIEADHDVSRIKTILSSDIFEPNNLSHPLRESAFIEVMICLRDLMSKVERYSTRISFSDDLVLRGKTKDITDTITDIRDATCHIDSFKKVADEQQTRVAFCSITGKGRLLETGGIALQSDYEDDTCFFYGHHRLYLKRHIIRALNEAEAKLGYVST